MHKNMNEYFILKSTYEIIIEFETNTRPIRIEIFQSVENRKKYRARVWDGTIYNLYPTFANTTNENGLENRMMSCDEINRDITTILSDDPNDLFYGKEWDSEEQYLSFIKELIEKYKELINE